MTDEDKRQERTLVVRFRDEQADVYDRLQDYAIRVSRETGTTVHMTDLVRTWVGEKVGVGASSA